MNGVKFMPFEEFASVVKLTKLSMRTVCTRKISPHMIQELEFRAQEQIASNWTIDGTT